VVAPDAIALVRENRLRVLDAPRAAGHEVGPILCAHRFAGRLAVVTDETDDGLELWWTSDGERSSAPTTVALNGGRALASSEGSHGTLVGARERGGKLSGCATFVSNGGASTSFAKGLGAIAGLSAVASGPEHDHWAAAGVTPSDIARWAKQATTS
jgi:hypothetical protein